MSKLNSHNGYQDRYTSKEAALEGHDRAIAIAKGEIKDE